LLRFEDSFTFSQALAQAIGFAGPSNCCPVLIGSIGGARWGHVQIEDTLFHNQINLMPRL
jgi:hypothetical protein